MKKILSCFLILTIIFFSACQIKKEIEENTTILSEFKIDTELFFYKGTENADAIAVDEEGYLYTATCITELEEGATVDASTYSSFIQLFQVYDLEGTCIKEVELTLGTGSISFLTAREGKLYCIAMKSELATWGPTLYTIDTKTWEIEELYQFANYNNIENVVCIGDYFYVVGWLKEVPEKEYELHPDIYDYTYQGECVSRVNIGEEQVEVLSVDFPIDIIGTNKDTLLVYHYNEEKGFGFLEFNPQEETWTEVGWLKDKQASSNFVACGDGFLFYKDRNIFYGTPDGIEAEISSKEILIKHRPTYQRGFLFYNIGGVERMGAKELIKENTPIRFLLHSSNIHQPYDNGYQVEKIEVDNETYALKVLAQDTDFDMYLLRSREPMSHNIKEKGAFYALNEVKGVKEYLDACFPYVKEMAINENGDVWMIPVALEMPILIYDKQYCQEQGVDWDTLNFEEFLSLVEKAETKADNEGIMSTYVLVEEFFKKYLSVYDSFDTALFRNYAKKIRNLTENLGILINSRSNITSVKPTIEIGKTYTKEELEQIPSFFYEYEISVDSLFSVSYVLGNSDMFGATRVPMLSEDAKNIGFVTFLSVNPQSKNLEVVLDYISDFCQYMMTKKDSFMLADQSMYTDIPFLQECYQVYKEGDIYFAMDDEIYWNAFWDYAIKGTIELEEMVEEIERKRQIYVGE